MGIYIQQDDYTILKQNILPKYVKLDVLDFSMNTLDEISGDLINMSVSIDANSDLRRSCQVSLLAKESKYAIQSGGRIWIDRYVRPWVGYENIHTHEIQWYNQGVFIINAPTYKYDATTNTLSFEGLDLMSQLTGIRNGQLEGLETIIPQGSNVREALISTLSQLGNFNKYIIDNCKYSNGVIQDVPNDIQINQGGTVYDILKALRDILPSYEIFFDNTGTFIYQQIPTGQHEAVILDDDILGQIVTDESVDVDFENVKNIIEVWGKTHDIDYVAENVVIDNNDIELTVPAIEGLPENKLIGFTPNEVLNGEVNVKVIGKQTKGTYTIKDIQGVAYGALNYGGGFVKAGVDNPYKWLPINLENGTYYLCRIYFNFTDATSVSFALNYKNQVGGKWFGISYTDVSFAEGIDTSNCAIYYSIPNRDTVDNRNFGSIYIPSGEHFVDVFLTVNTFTVGDYYDFEVEPIPYFNGIDENYYPLVMQSGDNFIQLKKDVLYLISWNNTSKTWIFVGHQQAQAVAKDTNPNSPFCTTTNNSLYNIRLVLYGGEYDNIYTDELAQQRADYELWKRTRLEDSINLSCVPIPWLDVNQVVNYTPHNSNESHQYIIKSISTEYGDSATQTINMIRYYPLYPDI